MKFNNIPDFLNALEDRMAELEEQGAVTSSSDIESCGDIEGCGNINADEDVYFSSGVNEEVDDIIAEAESRFDNDSDITKYIYEELSTIGYSDSEIVDILNECGF